MNEAALTTPTAETTTAADILDSKAPHADSAAPKVDDRISSKLSVLTSRERKAVDRERAASAKEQDILAREKKLQDFETLKQSNPLEALKLLGLSYQDLTQIALNDGAVTPDIHVKRVEEKFDSFLKSQEDAKRLEQEESKRQSAAREQEMTAKFQGEIKTYLKDNGSRYELIAFEQSEDLVYDVIDEHYMRTAPKDSEGNPTGPGEVMTIAQAADKVELHLEQKYTKARDLNKVKGLLAVRQEQKTDTKPQTVTRQPQKTLTNNLSASGSRQSSASITDEERVAKAIAFARGLRS
jgi:hypothetical protein